MSDFKHPVGGESRTRQSDTLRSDVNSVLSRYAREQLIPSTGVQPRYGDFTSVVSFHEAKVRVAAAEQLFELLPIAVKKHCEQDVGKFLDMCFDPERREELEELGLVKAQLPEALIDDEPEPKAKGSPEPEPSQAGEGS